MKTEQLHTCQTCGQAGFTARGLAAHAKTKRCKPDALANPQSAIANPQSIVAPLPPLADLAEQANQAIGTIQSTEQKFAADTLPQRLRIGLACLKAHSLFAVPDPGKRNKSGRNQHSKEASSRREELSDHDCFEGWLAAEVKELKRPVAYKYMQAARGLGLTITSQPGDIDTELAKYETLLGKQITMADLLEAGTPAKPEPPPQLPLNLVFEHMRGYRLHCETIISLRPRMDKPAFDCAVARTYATLKELTGSEWAPADYSPDGIDLESLDASGW